MRVASLRNGLDVFEAEHARGCHGRPWAGGVRWLELEFDLARVGAEERSTRAHLPSEPQRQGRDSSGGAERRGQCCDRAPQLAEGLLALLSRPWLHRCDVRPHPPRRRRNRRPDSDPALDHRQASPQGLRSHDRRDDQGDRAGPGGLLREHPQQGVPGRRGAGAVVIVRCVRVRPPVPAGPEEDSSIGAADQDQRSTGCMSTGDWSVCAWSKRRTPTWASGVAAIAHARADSLCRRGRWNVTRRRGVSMSAAGPRSITQASSPRA